MKIFNEFGIKPTRNHTAAGFDFYIPELTDVDIKEADNILEAWSKSYGKTVPELRVALQHLIATVRRERGDKFCVGNELNILQLWLLIDSPILRYVGSEESNMYMFVTSYLTFDSSNKPGINVYSNDHVFINSGIHVGLKPGTAGIFFNKSGRGTKGWDVRACVVDEDYTGFVHLSLAYTKDDVPTKIYVGDKIVQMLVMNIDKEPAEEIGKDEYYKLMENSQRGAAGFGSSDEKH